MISSRSAALRPGRVTAGVLAGMAGAAVLAAAPAAVASPAQQLRFRTINVPGAAATELLAINDFGVLAGGYQDAIGWHGFIKTAYRSVYGLDALRVSWPPCIPQGRTS